MFDPFKGIDQNSIISISSENESALVVDPLADLLLSVVAIIIIALIVILPSIPLHPTSTDGLTSSIPGLPQNSGLRLNGRRVEPLVATGQGLTLGESPSEFIPVGRVFLDGNLISKLKRMRDEDETVVLFIEPNGLETAFQFEVIANQYGPKRILQVRVDSDCNYVKSDRLAAYCATAARSFLVH
jgi:hypothetical protein